MAVFRLERPERRRRIEGYGGRYEVGDLGRVYGDGYELSLIDGKYVNLSEGGVARRVKVAYLVARAFIANAECRPYVGHRDGDLRNNRVENLYWTEEKHGWARGRKAVDGKGVLQYTVEGEFVARYGSIAEASAATGVARSLIRNCAEGKARRAKGFVFRFGTGFARE